MENLVGFVEANAVACGITAAVVTICGFVVYVRHQLKQLGRQLSQLS